MRLGVDLGTTWTAAAVHTAAGCEALQLATHTIATPSVVASADGALVVGDAAERRMASDPAAGAREFKRRLGDSTPYVLSGVPYGAEALMAQLLRHVLETAESQHGARPDAVTLTHPANWGEFKLDLLREAARMAGLDDVELMAEPAAAARHYAHLGRLEPGQTVAVFDFGGGTFDAAVVRNGDDGPELLGTPEGLERLGGVDIDHAVLAHVDAALDGQLGELDTTDPAVRAAVARLRAECTAAKEALSTDTETTIHVAVPGLETEIRITRKELEAVMRQRMDDLLGSLERAVASAGMALSDLAGVLLVGGSSRMPAVAELVGAATGLPTLIDADPKLVVAAGAAWPQGPADAPSAAPADVTGPGERGASPAASATTGSVAAAAARRDRLRRAVSLLGKTAAASAVAVGGYFAYQQWWDGDGVAEASGPDELGEDALAAGLAEAIFSEAAAGADSLDAFDAAAGAFAPPAAPMGGAGGFAAGDGGDGGGYAGGGGGGGGGGGYAGGGGGGGNVFSSRPSGPPRHTERPRRADPPEPSPSMDDAHTSGPSATTRPEDLVSDPDVEAIRMQLRERITKLDIPDGTDPADAAKLRGDLEGLLDRFRPAPGQSVDDAVASLRYEFEDRVRDFAQDQRIDALIEEQQQQDATGTENMPPTWPAGTPDAVPAATPDMADNPGTPGTPGGWGAPQPSIETIRNQLRERITALTIPDGTDPADAAKLRGDLEGLLDRFRPAPGQSVDDAVASLRYEFEDRVRDFAQDQRIDALIEEQQQDAAGTDGAPPAGGLADVFDDMAATPDGWNAPIGDSPPPTTTRADRTGAGGDNADHADHADHADPSGRRVLDRGPAASRHRVDGRRARHHRRRRCRDHMERSRNDRRGGHRAAERCAGGARAAVDRDTGHRQPRRRHRRHGRHGRHGRRDDGARRRGGGRRMGQRARARHTDRGGARRSARRVSTPSAVGTLRGRRGSPIPPAPSARWRGERSATAHRSSRRPGPSGADRERQSGLHPMPARRLIRTFAAWASDG